MSATTFPKFVPLVTSLARHHDASDGQLVLQPGDGAKLGSLGASEVFAISATFLPGPYPEQTICNFRATGRTGDTLTGVAADSNSTDAVCPAGTPMTVRLTQSWVESLQAALNAVEASGGSSLQETNAQTDTTYAFVIGDAGKLVTLSNGGSVALSLPLHATVAFVANTTIDVFNLGAGAVTLTPVSGATVNGSGSAIVFNQYQGGTLKQLSSNTWIFIGSHA